MVSSFCKKTTFVGNSVSMVEKNLNCWKVAKFVGRYEGYWKIVRFVGIW